MAFPSHPSRIRAAVFLYGSEQHSTQLAGKAKKRKDGGRVSLGRAVGRWYTRWWHSPSLARPTNQSSRLSAPLFFSSCPVNVSLPSPADLGRPEVKPVRVYGPLFPLLALPRLSIMISSSLRPPTSLFDGEVRPICTIAGIFCSSAVVARATAYFSFASTI